MAEPHQIKLGDILRETIEVLSAHRRAALVYLAIFVPLATMANWLDVEMGLVDTVTETWGAEMRRDNGAFGLLVLLASIAGQYLLFERILLAGRQAPARFARILGFLGLALVSFLGVGFATILLIIPGLFVGARWLMSPAFFVGEGKGVFESLGESWTHTKGNTGTVMLALFLLLVVAILIGATVGGILGGVGILTDRSWSQYLIDGLFGEIWAVVLIAVSVGTFRLLGPRTGDLAHTFS